MPTTMSKALARVTATLNLWKEGVAVTGGKGLKEGRIPSTHQFSDLGVLEETQVKVQIQLYKALAAPHGGDEDDAAFLALELFHGAHLEGERQGLQRGRSGEAEAHALPRAARWCREVTGHLSQWRE